MFVEPGLCLTWSETDETGFLIMWPKSVYRAKAGVGDGTDKNIEGMSVV